VEFFEVAIPKSVSACQLTSHAEAGLSVRDGRSAAG
jgi:hypothetical protein